MKKKIIFLFSVLITHVVYGQIQWQKSLGGSDRDEACSIRQTSDGGYIVAGFTYSNDGDVTFLHDTLMGASDYWIVKINSSGAIQWQKSLGGSSYDVANSIQQTADGGYIIGGFSFSNNGDVSGQHGTNYDYWIVKLNSSGVIQWQKCLGGTDGENALSIQQTMEGGYIIAGFTFSNDGDVTGYHGGRDAWIVKLNSSGVIQWQKCLGGSADEIAFSVDQTSDGGYIIAGSTSSNDGDVSGLHSGGNCSLSPCSDYWVVKLNSSGGIQWQKALGGSEYDEAESIQQTIDGGFIVTGYSKSIDGDVTGLHGSRDYWVVKLTVTGSIQWQKCLGGSNFDAGRSVQQTSDGGYIVAGTGGSIDGDATGNHGSYDYWVIKLNSSGVVQGQKSLGGSNGDEAYSIQQTTDGGYIIAGYSLSSNGDVTGHHGTNSYEDYWIVKVSSAIGIEEVQDNTLLNLYPNPSTNSFTIQSSITKGRVEIYNSTGAKVFETIITQKSEIINHFSPGIYLVKVSDGEKVLTQKLVIN